MTQDLSFFLNPFVLGFVALILILAVRQAMLRPVKKTRPLPELAAARLNSTEKRPLTTPWALYMKYTLPAVWGIFFLAAGTAYFLGFRPEREWPPYVVAVVAACVVFLFFQGMMVLRIAWKIVKAEFDSKFLYLSHSSKAVSVPLSQLGEISEYKWLKHERVVKVSFPIPNDFGSSALILLKKKGLNPDEQLLDDFRRLAQQGEHA